MLRRKKLRPTHPLRIRGGRDGRTRICSLAAVSTLLFGCVEAQKTADLLWEMRVWLGESPRNGASVLWEKVTAINLTVHNVLGFSLWLRVKRGDYGRQRRRGGAAIQCIDRPLTTSY